MIKKSIFALAMAVSLTACTEDFKDWATPQSNEAEEQVSLSTSAAAVSSAIDLATVTGTTVKIVNITLPSDATLSNSWLTLANEAGEKVGISVDAAGNAAVEDLNSAVISLCGRVIQPNTLSTTFTGDVTFESISYPVKLDAGKLTLQEIPSNYPEYIYMPGNQQGWNTETACALWSENLDGVYTGFAYLDGNFKFTQARNWEAEYNWNDFTTVSAVFDNNDGSNINCNTPGYYYLMADVVNANLLATAVTFGLVGPATPGGWDAGAYTVMEYDQTEQAWVVEAALTAGEFKFTTNGNWDINLGGTADNLTINGGNLSIVEDGTYLIALYPGRNASETMYCTITKE